MRESVNPQLNQAALEVRDGNVNPRVEEAKVEDVKRKLKQEVRVASMGPQCHGIGGLSVEDEAADHSAQGTISRDGVTV